MKWQPKVSVWLGGHIGFVTIELDRETIKTPERWFGIACAKYATGKRGHTCSGT